jgi:hypothetical protein
MYINPNTTIKILHNVPLDNTYEHTIYFDTISAQSSYFSGLAKYTFEEQTYQRVKRGYIRIAKNAESLYDCNYLMFQNSAFGNKWFYAFINSVEYINNGVSEIEFEIDDMQTWHFDYHLQDCFVEREHSNTDNVGDNIVPENLELGDYVYSNFHSAGIASRLRYYVDATITERYNPFGGGSYTIMKKPIFSGLYHFSATADELVYWTNGMGLDGSITDTGTINENKVKVRDGVINIRLGCETRKGTVNTNMLPYYGDYTIHNNKLFTYPYNFVYVTNFQGNTTTYKYEYFANNKPQFSLSTDEMADSPAILIPTNYKGQEQNMAECLTFNKFPTCAWSSSYYGTWLARTVATTVPNMVTNVVSGAVSGAMLGSPQTAVAGAGISAISSVISLMGEKHMAEITPPQAKGTQSGFTNYYENMIDFGIYQKHITIEIAQTIDDYFDKFGYATHRLKVPNRNVRPHWCYTKTVGCTIKGSVPCDDMRKICSIYDKGITFWKKGNEVGNYSLDNRVKEE